MKEVRKECINVHAICPVVWEGGEKSCEVPFKGRIEVIDSVLLMMGNQLTL